MSVRGHDAEDSDKMTQEGRINVKGRAIQNSLVAKSANYLIGGGEPHISNDFKLWW